MRSNRPFSMTSGWVDWRQSTKPESSFAPALLPSMEQSNVAVRLDTNVPIDAPVNIPFLRTTVPTFVCPSDPGQSIFEIGEEEAEHEAADHEGWSPLYFW